MADGSVVNGPDPSGQLTSGLTYCFFGAWHDHWKYGKRFRFQHFVSHYPSSRDGVVKYLAKYAPGVGPAIANALYDEFGGDAVRVLRTDPERASVAVPRLALDKARDAATALSLIAENETTKVELIGLFANRGFPRTLIDKCIEKWGTLAPQVIKRNPYALLTSRLPGCSFNRCDRLWMELGHDAKKLRRQMFAAWNAITSNSSGNTWFPVNVAFDAVRGCVSSANVQPAKAVKMAERIGWLTLRNTAGQWWVAGSKQASEEQYVASRLSHLRQPFPQWPRDVLHDCSDHQRLSLALATAGPVGILGGTPGTGKTYTAANLVRALAEQHGYDNIAICAPTGKAAVRCSEAMRRYGLDLEATTIHRLLGVERSGNSSSGFVFVHGEHHPLPHRFVLVDETSMVSTDLAACLLAACSPGTHLLFLGDPYQLAPVGHGAPLRDMIAAGLPYGELTEIHRNAGAIVRACAALKAGQPYEPCDEIDLDNGKNLLHVEASTPESTLDATLEVIRRLGDRGYNPVLDLQLLCAVNDKSVLSRKALNKRLQDVLNPGGLSSPGNPFRTGDKVICLRNCVLDQHFIANGDIGIVLSTTPSVSVVRFGSPVREVTVPVSKDDDGASFDLAYAITIHKSQGSGFPVVIAVADDYYGANMVACREAWYTALSRAEQLCITVGKRSTINQQCKRVSLKDRTTYLKELIQGT